MAENPSGFQNEVRERLAESAVEWQAALSDLKLRRDANGLVIFVGSAASLFPPTCHPLGQTTSGVLHDYLLSAAENPTEFEVNTVRELPFEALLHFGSLEFSADDRRRSLAGAHD